MEHDECDLGQLSTDLEKGLSLQTGHTIRTSVHEQPVYSPCVESSPIQI